MHKVLFIMNLIENDTEDDIALRNIISTHTHTHTHTHTNTSKNSYFLVNFKQYFEVSNNGTG